MAWFNRFALLILLSLGIGALPLKSWGYGLSSGNQAPNFLVESGENKQLSLDMIRGKVIVLFYESRNMIRKNLSLKNELKRLYREQPADVQKDIFRLVVIDCSEAIWATAPIWKSKLMDHSRKEGFTIYGDWDQKMLADYHLQPGDSNFLIIDKKGIIRYSAVSKVGNGQFENIKNLLFALVKE